MQPPIHTTNLELGHPKTILDNLMTDSDEDFASGSDIDVEEPAIPTHQAAAEEE